MSKFEEPVASPCGLMAQLNKLRAEVFSAGVQAYLMLDPVLVEPWLRHEKNKNIKEHVIPIRQAEIPLQACPFFVSLGSANDWLLDKSFHVAWEEAADWLGERTVCGWFSSTLEASELKQVLARQVLQGRLDARWLLRFYDPRVLRHLSGIIQQQFRIRGVERWFFLDEKKEIRSVEGVSISNHAYQFRRQEEALLDEVGLINQAYSQWASWMTPPEDAFEQLFLALRVGRAHGLELKHEADCVSFMLHKCLIHPHIEQHPRVQKWLESARIGASCYADQAATCDQAIWQEIQAGNWYIAKQENSSW